jgi:hypothetical protein
VTIEHERHLAVEKPGDEPGFSYLSVNLCNDLPSHRIRANRVCQDVNGITQTEFFSLSLSIER